MRRVWKILILLVIVGGGIGWYVHRAILGSTIEFRTDTVTRGTLRVEVHATGTLQPAASLPVGTKVSGRIVEILADFNQPVERGQILARIEAKAYEAQVAQDTAAVKRTKANEHRLQVDLEKSRSELNRMQGLVDKGINTPADLESAKFGFDAAQAQLEVAQAEVTEAEQRLNIATATLEDTTIRSPISGVVLTRDVSVGQTVAAAFQAPQLFIIAEDLTKMLIVADLDQADIGQVNLQQAVEFTVDAYADRTFTGKVREIRMQGRTEQNVVTYPVLIEVDNPELKLKPQMTADVAFKVAEKANVLRCPKAALRFDPEPDWIEGAPAAGGAEAVAGDGPVVARSQHTFPVWVQAGRNKVRRVTITIELENDYCVEVTAGDLKPGDSVVTGGPRPEVGNSGRRGGGKDRGGR